MFNFSYANKTEIHFGADSLDELGQFLPKDKKILMLYGGGSIKKNGVYEKAISALKEHDFDEFGGIEPNPQYETLMKAVTKIKEEGFDYLLAVGGGSVVDGSKFIAAAALLKDTDPWKILSESLTIKEALPIGCVLTLPATGSETNMNAVVSKGQEKLYFGSPEVRPQFAILDPKTTLSLSERQTANGIVDAFIHVMEQYLTYPVNAKIQDRYSEGVLLTLVEEGIACLKSPKDIAVRSNIMWAATQALNGLLGVGVPEDWTTHMIGHEITGFHGIDHARTLTIIFPAVMEYRRKEKGEKIVQYGKRVWGIEGDSVDSIIDKTIEKTVEFFRQLNMPVSLKDVNLDDQIIDPIISSLEKHGRIQLGEHDNITLKDSRAILNLALNRK